MTKHDVVVVAAFVLSVGLLSAGLIAVVYIYSGPGYAVILALAIVGFIVAALMPTRNNFK